MAVTVEIQYSRGGAHDAAFADLVTLTDNGSGFLFDYASALTPGDLYLFRARRRDDSQPSDLQYSDWSPVAYARVPFPLQERYSMNADQVVTGVETEVYIGIEDIPGLPVKVTDKGAYEQGGINRNIQRAWSKDLRNAPTMRRKGTRGKVTWEGSITVEVSPEGFFPRLLLMCFPVATTNLTSPTRYLQHYPNAFGSKTGTLVQRKGNTIYVYPGCRVTKFSIAPSKESEDVLVATFELIALDELIYPIATVPTILDDCGMSAAGEDPLEPYSHQECEMTIGGAVGGTKTLTFDVTRKLTRRMVGDGTRGATGTTEGQAATSGSATCNYEDNTHILRDMGIDTMPSGGFAVGDTLITAPVQATFLPPDNDDGFPNLLTVCFPQADIKTQEPVNGPDEVPENLTFEPVDAIGDPAGTDMYIDLVNSETHASLVAPGAPFVGTTAFQGGTKSKAKKYEYGVVSNTPTPTTTVFKVGVNQYLDARDNYYVGRTIRFLTGTLKGTEKVISGYDAANRTFTLSSALGSAPATGDIFGIL